MQPIVNRDDMYFRFMRANGWALKYFPNFKLNIPKRLKTRRGEKSLIVNTMETVAMFLEKRYMKAKQTTEITTKHLIHFNKKDSTNKILREFRKRKRKMS